MKTLRLTSESSSELSQAARILQAGGLVAVPTETVYGLAADAADEKAVSAIFTAKGRPSDHPLIVHVSGVDQLAQWATDIPAEAYLLAEAFWPGPLTLLLKKHPQVSSVVTGGLDTIGLRNPAHPVLLGLLKKAQLGVAAPSANPYKKLSPTTADQVYASLSGKVDAVLDGGPCAVGIESTIVDLSTGNATVLRPGPITAAQMTEVLGQSVTTPTEHTVAVPGNVEAHYQPGKPLCLMTTEQLKEQITDRDSEVACVYYSQSLADSMNTQDIKMPKDKASYAQALYDTLYQLDQSEGKEIWLELPPVGEAWSDVHDRLKRAGRFWS